MSIEESIYKLRKKNNLSQGELASKMDVSRQSISKWETGQSVPDLKNIIKLSEIFNVTVDEIVKDKNINESKEENNKLEYNSKNFKYQRNKTLGYIFMAVGALICIISVFLIPAGILFGVPFFIFGIELVLIRRHIKLVISWTALIYISAVFNPWMTSVPKTTKAIIYAIKSGYFNTASILIGVTQRVMVIILLIITVRTVKRNKMKKT